MQVSRYTIKQVCKYESNQVWKYESMKLCKYKVNKCVSITIYSLQVCKYSSLGVYNYANIQQWKYAILPVFWYGSRYAKLHLYIFADKQVGRHKHMQVCKYTIISVYKYPVMQLCRCSSI